MRVDAPPLATLLALGRLGPDGWKTRHDLVDLSVVTPAADPPERAATRMLGSTTSRTEGAFAIVTDKDIPADGAPWTYRVALSDVFGRFGDPTEIDVPTPARPLIPQPALRSHLTLADRAAGDGREVVGSLRLTLVVPALHEMTAGSRPLARAVVDLDGVEQDDAAPQEGGTLGFDFALPALLPLESRTLTASAHFEDEEGNLGSAATLQVKVCDPRAPPVPRTGIGIVWSSRPAPAADVEFRLRFTGVAGARYRAYLANSRGLDIALVDGDRPRTRAEIAVEGAQRGLAGLDLRDRFRLLTEQPLIPGGDGKVLFDTACRARSRPYSSCASSPLATRAARRPSRAARCCQSQSRAIAGRHRHASRPASTSSPPSQASPCAPSASTCPRCRPPSPACSRSPPPSTRSRPSTACAARAAGCPTRYTRARSAAVRCKGSTGISSRRWTTRPPATASARTCAITTGRKCACHPNGACRKA